MKVELPIEHGYFRINPCNFCGIESYLIIPEIDAKWNKNNLFFRSLIVDNERNVLSCGFPKFFNYGEKLECYPDPNLFKDWKIDEKIDGSLLICDYVNGQFSMRTRGTFTYKTQENYKDFEVLLKKYPKVQEFLKQNSHLSLLFEIVTPNNIIVIRPKDIQFYFLGAINKNELCVVKNEDLINIWRKLGGVPVPTSYQFDILPDLLNIVKMIKSWNGKEGVVISYNQGQNRLKLKSDWYCWIHKIKSQLNSESNLIEYYINCDMPTCDDFFKKIENEYDYEIAIQLKKEIDNICNVGRKVKQEIQNMKDFAHSIRKFETRKKQAEYIMSTFGKNKNSSFVFSLLDGKELDKNQKIKLMKNFLQNSVDI